MKAHAGGNFGNAQKGGFDTEAAQDFYGVEDYRGPAPVFALGGSCGFCHGASILADSSARRRNLVSDAPPGYQVDSWGQASMMLFSGPKPNLVMFSTVFSPMTRMSCSR